MKQLLSTLLLASLCTVVHAEVTCQTYGNTTNCNGSLGHSGISPLQAGDMSNFGNDIAAQQQAAAQANLANQQAALVAQQREYLRQQTEALRTQQDADAWQRLQQDSALRRQQYAENLQRQQDAEALKRQQQTAGLKTQQDAENSQRMQNDEASQEQQYDGPLKKPKNAPPETSNVSAMLACVRRFPRGQTEEEVSAISDRCQKDTGAAPQNNRQTEARLVQSDSAPPPSGTGPQFRQKWNALDDALASGVLTRAEYDNKLSALLAKQRRDPNDRMLSQAVAK